MSDTQLSFLSGTDRQRQILDLIEQRQRLTVAEIVEQFAVSEATARRDLDALAVQQKIQRVHGGAIALLETPPELPILERKNEQPTEKTRIGRVAAELVRPRETIFLGSGTTVLEVARALRERTNLTILTNSLPVLNLLSGTDNTLICLGGMLRETELSFIGHLTEQALAEVRADKVFMGTRAITPEGLTNEYLPETLTDRAILNSGREIIIVADHTKFGRTATVLLAPLEKIHTLITDHETDQAFIQALQEKDINILLA
ncbi:MAG: DeoR/GlpR transcriptional regulator [Anaerolineales bacterium]|nr:DeoR/GlpR transcriptional regulator [Anaerolineales bacterium]